MGFRLENALSRESELILSREEREGNAWLKTASAFLNTDGGTISFVVSAGENDALSAEVRGRVAREMDPRPAYDTGFREEDGRPVFYMKFRRGKETPYFFTGEGCHAAYVRHEGVTCPAGCREIRTLVMSGIMKSYDSISTERSLDMGEFSTLARAWKEKTFDDLRLSDLIMLGLVDEEGRLTNAGVLFSDRPGADGPFLVTTRWDGSSMGRVREETGWKGSILELLKAATGFIDTQLP